MQVKYIFAAADLTLEALYLFCILDRVGGAILELAMVVFAQIFYDAIARETAAMICTDRICPSLMWLALEALYLPQQGMFLNIQSCIHPKAEQFPVPGPASLIR